MFVSAWGPGRAWTLTGSGIEIGGQEPRRDLPQGEGSSSQEEGHGAPRGEVPGGISSKKPLPSFDEFQKTRGVKPGMGQVTFRIPRQGQELHTKRGCVHAQVALECTDTCTSQIIH